MATIDWYKYDDKKKRYVFNHREFDGPDDPVNGAPVPKSDIQRKAWAGARWYYEIFE